MRAAVGGVCLVVVLLLLGQVAFNLAREERWLGAAAAGGAMAFLLLIVLVSQRAGRIRPRQSRANARSRRKSG